MHNCSQVLSCSSDHLMYLQRTQCPLTPCPSLIICHSERHTHKVQPYATAAVCTAAKHATNMQRRQKSQYVLDRSSG